MSSASLLLSLFAPSGQGGSGATVLIVQLGLFAAIFYVFLIRPQRRQQEEHKKLLLSLQRGDKVVTSSGIIGEVVHIKEDEVTIRSGEAKFVILRSGITSITNRTAAPAVEAKTS